MKIDLSTLFEMIEQEDKNFSKTSAPVKQEKQKETALDLQGLFSLFEQLEPQLDEAENLEGFKNVEMVLKVPRARITSATGNRDTEDYRYFGQLVGALVGNERTPANIFNKLKQIQNKLMSAEDLTSLSETVSGMVLLESFYSFFNAFYTIGSSKTEQGTKLGNFGESFISALYGSQGTIPSGFANSKLYSLADLFDRDGTPISLKIRKETGDLGAKFFLLHDLVKYNKIYFDLLFKEVAGAGNIYQVFFERHVVTLKEYEQIANDLEKDVIQQLKNVYYAINERSFDTASGNSDKDSRTRPYVTKVYHLGLLQQGLKNDVAEKIKKLITHHNDTLITHKTKYTALRPKKLISPLQEDGEELRKLQSSLAGIIEELFSLLAGYNYVKELKIPKDESTLKGKINALVEEFAQNNDIKELKREIEAKWNQDSELRGKLPSFIEQKKEGTSPITVQTWEELKQEIVPQQTPQQTTQEPQEPTQAEPAQTQAQQPQPQQTPDDDAEKQFSIFQQDYGPIDRDKLKEVKLIYTNNQNLGKIRAREVEGKVVIKVDLDLSPDNLKQMFENGNNSIEENYKNLVNEMNQISELMNTYFLSKTSSAKVGDSLKDAAKKLPETTEKAVEKNPIKE